MFITTYLTSAVKKLANSVVAYSCDGWRTKCGGHFANYSIQRQSTNKDTDAEKLVINKLEQGACRT